MNLRQAISDRLVRIADAIYEPPIQNRDAIGFRLPHNTGFSDLYKQPYGLPWSHIEDE